MRVCITGGMGFIGVHLTDQLIRSGHEVLIIDCLTPQIHGDNPRIEYNMKARFCRLDVRDLPSQFQLMDGFDAVVHLAAETGTAQSMYKIMDYTSSNCSGLAAVMEAISKTKSKPRKIVLASSRSVYGEGAYAEPNHPDVLVSAVPRSRAALERGQYEPCDSNGKHIIPMPTPEDFPFEPSSVYAATKASQELLLTSACVGLGVEPVILRFQNVYGPGQSLRNPYTGIISIFFNRARQGLPINIYEDGLESRDFVFVSDVCSAIESSINGASLRHAVFNIGSGVPTTVIHLARTLLATAGFSVPIVVSGDFRIGDIRHCYADIGRAREGLGFFPITSLEHGLARFCEWATLQPQFEDLSGVASEHLAKHGLARKSTLTNN